MPEEPGNIMSDQASGDLPALRDALRSFAAKRDWDLFHTPRNLAAYEKMALNAKKYPVEKSRGSIRKYDRL